MSMPRDNTHVKPTKRSEVNEEVVHLYYFNVGICLGSKYVIMKRDIFKVQSLGKVDTLCIRSYDNIYIIG